MFEVGSESLEMAACASSVGITASFCRISPPALRRVVHKPERGGGGTTLTSTILSFPKSSLFSLVREQTRPPKFGRGE